MIKTLDFVFASPTMIGGSQPKHGDEGWIRPPSLRGVLRFWTRALAGTAHRAIETEMWGSTDTGQGITIIGTDRWRYAPVNHEIFPSNARMSLDMIPEEATEAFTIRFRVPEHLGHLQEQFRAVVWTWFHLGTIGLRSRRGYGAPLLTKKGAERFFGDDAGLPCVCQREFTGDPEKLAQRLATGLTTAINRFGGTPTSARMSSNWFRLSSLEQVFVGKFLNGKEYDSMRHGMEDLLHGLDENARSNNGTEKKQLGRAKGGRQASPMLWRPIPVYGDDRRLSGYIPVMTWSPLEDFPSTPPQLSPRTGLDRYLREKLGFDVPLGAGGTSLFGP
jgi:CRISPR/Cas system CMR-associated protein Cmr1 (group 7 of RAMP superfamily)